MQDIAITSVTDLPPDRIVSAANDRPCNKYTFPSVLDFTQARSLLETLMAQASDCPSILDASAVERMSTPCAQILLAAGRAADHDGAILKIAGASKAFREALSDLGLTSEFKKWMI